MATAGGARRSDGVGRAVWLLAALTVVGGCSTGRIVARPDAGASTMDAGTGGVSAAGSGGNPAGTGGVGPGAGGSPSAGTGGLGLGGGAGGNRGSGGAGAGGAGGAGGASLSGTGGRTGTGGTTNPGTGGSCISGQMLCSDGCKSTGSDPSNCGACGKVCGLNQECIASTCQCRYLTQVCTAGGPCIDLTSDVHNCAACGRDCGIGTCSDSQCVPVLMKTATTPAAVASDGTTVFATDADGGILYGCPLSQCGGGGTMTTLRSNLARPMNVLAVSSAGSVFVSQSLGGPVLNLTSAGVIKSMISFAGGGATNGLATDGTSLFMADGANSAIVKTPLTANTPSSAFPLLTRDLVYDATSNSIFANASSTISKCPVAGTTCTPFYTPAPGVLEFGVTAAAGHLFIALGVGNPDPATPTNTGVFTCPTTAATCIAAPFLTYPTYTYVAAAMIADASYAYAALTPAGASGLTIFRCSVNGCQGSGTPVFSSTTTSLSYPAAFAVDASAIYWTVFGNQIGVARLAKQP